MKDTLYLALDQGGHASRAILFNARGETLAQAFRPIGTRRTPEGYVEHDPEEIIDSLQSAIADLPPEHAIEAAGLATQRSSIVCWNRESGAALSPVISWQDRRQAAFVETLRPHAARIHALTGLVLSPHYGASKLRWCLEHLPAVRAAAADGTLALGPLSSFVLHRLLGEKPVVVDPANASRTQLWDPATRQWAPELMEFFGVPTAYLPRPVSSAHPYGTLRVGGQAVPLRACTGDQAAVPFAFGAVRSELAYVNLGTGAFILRSMPQPVAAASLLSSVIWSDEHTVTYALEGTINGAGSALEWVAQREALDGKALLAALPAQLDAAMHPPLFLNGISGLGSPFWIADFPSRFVGEGTAQEKFVAALESILFLTRVNLDEMQQHASRPGTIVVTGGLAASDYLCQSLADLIHLPVTRYQEREATARGLAFLTAGQPQDWLAPPAERFHPQLNTALRERFFAWLKAMKQAIAA